MLFNCLSQKEDLHLAPLRSAPTTMKTRTKFYIGPETDSEPESELDSTVKIQNAVDSKQARCFVLVFHGIEEDSTWIIPKEAEKHASTEFFERTGRCGQVVVLYKNNMEATSISQHKWAAIVPEIHPYGDDEYEKICQNLGISK